MINVLKLNSVSKLVNEIFDNKYKLTDECANPELIIVRSAQMAEYQPKENLLAVGRAGAGVNNIPFADYAKKGVVVFNTPGANANAVKELVVAALLLSCRKIFEGINWAKGLDGKGSEVKGLIEKGKSQFTGREITGKTLGIAGLGAIGRLIADSCSALGMKVICYDAFLAADAIANSSVTPVASMDEIYEKSDFITLNVPLTPDTKQMINKDSIAKMKDGAVIINCARGELVNNSDIIEAVNAGKIFKYFTDFPVEELLNVENIIPCPHLGASTPEAEDNCAVMVAKQLKDYVENGNIKNSVNFPNLSEERSGGFRITVLACGNPDAVTQISAALADARLNITKTGSAVRGDALYFIADTADSVTPDVTAKLEKINGVSKVRVLA